MTYFPASPRVLAASVAALISASDKPSSSARVSTTTAAALVPLGVVRDVLLNHGLVGEGVAEIAAHYRRLEDFLAQLPIFQIGQGRLAGGVLQRDDIVSRQPACLGRFGRGADFGIGQTIEFGTGIDNHRRRVGAFEHVLRKLRLQARSEEHTSELQSLMRISYAVFCLKKKKTVTPNRQTKYMKT